MSLILANVSLSSYLKFAKCSPNVLLPNTVVIAVSTLSLAFAISTISPIVTNKISPATYGNSVLPIFHTFPFSVSSFTKSCTTSPRLISSTKPRIYSPLFVAFIRSTIFILNIALNTSFSTLYSPFSATCEYAVPFIPNLFPFLSAFLSTSYKRSPSSISLYASFTYASLSFVSIRSTTFILNVAVKSSAKLILTR